MRGARLVPVLVLVLLAAACSRAVSIGSDPAPTYAVEVHNATGTAVNVFYILDGAERVLGQVGIGDTERFVLAEMTGPDVRIVARPVGSDRIYGPYDLFLGAGETSRVVIPGGT